MRLVSQQLSLCLGMIFMLQNIDAATWNLNANGNWNVNGNWTLPAIFPNAIDAVAGFGNVITAGRTVTLGQNITIGTVTFDNNNNYLISGANTLAFDVSAGNAILTVNNAVGNGAHTIGSAIILNDSITITQNSTNAAGFTLSGGISGTGNVNFAGPQRINFSGLGTYAGVTNLNNGTIFYNVSGAFPGASVVNIGDGVGPANSTQLNINIPILTPAAFFANIQSDGTLIQGNNRIVRVSGLQGSGSVQINAIVVNVVEVQGNGGSTTFSGTITGGVAGGTFTGGSRLIKTGTSTLTLTGNTSNYICRTFIGSGSVINVQANNALGITGTGTANGAFVLSGGALELQGGPLNLNKYIGINGPGVTTSGALRNISGTNTIPNTVEVGWAIGTVTASDASIGVDAGSLTLSGTVIGANALTKEGPGTLIFSGVAANTYSGNTIVNNGILQLNKTGVNAIVSPSIFVNSTGTLLLSQANQIANTSNLVLGGGTFNMNGFVEEIQNLTFNSGVLSQGGALLTLNGAVTPLQMRDVTITENLAFTGAGGNIVFDPTNNGTAQILGNMNLGGIARTFDVPDGTAAIDMSVGGMILNGGVTKIGSGTLELAGANTYLGPTNINNGVLLVNGSLVNGVVTVNPSGFLGGTGFIGVGAAMVVNSGVVSPSTQTTVGTLTINGSYSQSGTGQLFMNILSPTNHDLLLVNAGTVSLSGGLTADFASGYSFNDGDRIILIDNTAGGGVSGTFSNFTVNNLASNSMAAINYDPKQVYLSIVIKNNIGDLSSISSTSSTGRAFSFLSNQRHLILDRRFDRLRRAGRDLRLWQNEMNEFQQVSDFNEPKSELTASLSPKFLKRQTVAKAVTEPSLDQKTDRKAKPKVGEFYTAPIGSEGYISDQGSQPGFHYWSAGVSSGIDYAFSRGSIGFFGAYQQGYSDTHRNLGKFDLKDAAIEIYGSVYLKPDFFLQAILGGSLDWVDFDRNTTLGIAHSSYMGDNIDALLGMGYDFWMGHFLITPEVAARYLFSEIPDHQETGAANLNISYGQQVLNSIDSWVSLKVGGVWQSNVRWIPQLRGSWQHQFLDPNTSLVFAPVGVDQISSLQIIGLNRNSFFVGASLRIEGDRWSGEAIYDAQLSPVVFAQYAYLGLGFQF